MHSSPTAPTPGRARPSFPVAAFLMQAPFVALFAVEAVRTLAERAHPPSLHPRPYRGRGTGPASSATDWVLGVLALVALPALGATAALTVEAFGRWRLHRESSRWACVARWLFAASSVLVVASPVLVVRGVWTNRVTPSMRAEAARLRAGRPPVEVRAADIILRPSTEETFERSARCVAYRALANVFLWCPTGVAPGVRYDDYLATPLGDGWYVLT